MKSTTRKGGSSQDRRRARRAAERDAVTAAVVEPDPGEALGAELAAEFAELADRARRDPVELSWPQGSIGASGSRGRRLVAEALLAAGETVTTPLQATFETTQGSEADHYFTRAVLNAGYVDVGGDRWPVELDALAEADHVLFRSGGNEVVLRLDDGTLVHARVSWGWMNVRVAAPAAARIADVCSAFRSRYPASFVSTADDGRVPITFWMNSAHGPIPHLRRIESASWDDVAGNYAPTVRAELAELMRWERPEADGQLFLWQGPPGTGKTWALRALASEWADWAEFHFITDPDSFFVHDSSYMVSVLLADSYEALDETGDVLSETAADGKWRVLILEDTGELLAANAKENYGQGLSRLLNVVDGMIGQGLRVLALVTTNDELGDLHPAVQRPGRCASAVTFGPIPPGEIVRGWGLDGSPIPEGGLTIAEVYDRFGSGRPLELAADQEEDAAPGMPCASCDHSYAMHPDGGACAMEDCSCSSFAEGEASAAQSDDAELAAEADAIVAAADSLEPATVVIRVTDQGREKIVRLHQHGVSTAAIGEMLSLRLGDLELLRADGSVVDAVEAELPEAPTQASGGVPWRAVLCPEGVPTDDGRIFAPGSVSWRDLPLTLMGLLETSAAGGHDKAQLAGRIDRIWRDDAGLIRAEGVFDDGDFGRELSELVADEKIRGVSVDLAVSRWEQAYRSDVLDENGLWIGGTEPGEAEPDPWATAEDDVMLVIWEGKIGMATVCPFQAFEPATIEIALAAGGSTNPMMWRFSTMTEFEFDPSPIVASAGPSDPIGPVGPSGPRGATARMTAELTARAVNRALESPLLASASEAPTAPPRDWFDDPHLDAPTPISIDDDGRIYGHAAVWDTCHMSYSDVCVAPPTSPSGYAYFLLGELETAEGDLIPIGKITMDTGHAPRTLGRTATLRHYDDTGTVVAHVSAGEDDHGIWVAGGLVPGLEEEAVRRLRGSTLSGDWRDANGLELVAMLAVNVPGFPVPRARAMVAATEAGTRTLALTAAGVLDADGPMTHTMSPKIAAQFAAIRSLVAGDWDELRARAAG